MDVRIILSPVNAYSYMKRVEDTYIGIKGRFLLFPVYRNFANLFSKLSVSTFYKEMSKFQQKVQR